MAITASEARRNLFPLLQQVNDDRVPVTITSKPQDSLPAGVRSGETPGSPVARSPAVWGNAGRRSGISRSTFGWGGQWSVRNT